MISVLGIEGVAGVEGGSPTAGVVGDTGLELVTLAACAVITFLGVLTPPVVVLVAA